MAEEAHRKESSQGPTIPPLELGDLSVTTPNAHEPQSAITTNTAVTARETQSEAGAETPTRTTAPTTSSEQPMTTSPKPTFTSPRPTSPTYRPSTDTPPGPLPQIDTKAPPLTRTATEAIGPSTDLPTPMLEAPGSALAAGPVIQFTLLLASTGTRHPFQINERYLNKRNVKAVGEGGNFDPGVISVYNLKELILKDWRDDWDAKPSSPSAIRLIFFGQLLADNVSLKDCKILTTGASNVLHITVKPQEAMDDEEAAKGGKSSMSRDREGGRSVGCRCVIL